MGRFQRVLVTAAVTVIPVSASAQTTEAVTFSKHIAPILQRSCQQCHRPNSVAPMSLLTYDEARPYARAMKARTALRDKRGAMPPWYIEKNVGIQHFKDDFSLREEEIAQIAPDLFGGVRYERLAPDGLQWPCPTLDHPGTATLHENGFMRGRGLLSAVPYRPSPEHDVAGFPYLLVTGRVLQHYNVGTMTRRTPHRELAPDDPLEIHPEDALREAVGDGDWVELESRWGATRARARRSSSSRTATWCGARATSRCSSITSSVESARPAWSSSATPTSSTPSWRS